MHRADSWYYPNIAWVPLSSEAASSLDPAVGLYLGPYGGSRGVEVSYERGSPVSALVFGQRYTYFRTRPLLNPTLLDAPGNDSTYYSSARSFPTSQIIINCINANSNTIWMHLVL